MGVQLVKYPQPDRRSHYPAVCRNVDGHLFILKRYLFPNQKNLKLQNNFPIPTANTICIPNSACRLTASPWKLFTRCFLTKSKS